MCVCVCVTRMELWTGEMPLTRFEECLPLLAESLPELPSNLNIITLTLWSINSGVLTALLLSHLSQTPCLP